MPTVSFEFKTRNAASVRREIQRTLDATREGQRAASATSTQAAQRSASAEQQATQVVLRESAKRVSTRQKEAQAVAKAEQQATAAVVSEEQKRTQAHSTGIRARIRGVMEYVRAAVSGERQISQAEQERRRRAAAVGRALSGAVSSVAGVGSTMHSQIQDARARRAQSERTAGLAFFQAGARSPEEIRRRMADTAAFAEREGMTVPQLLEGINAAQTEFSSLQGGSEEERRSRFNGMLQTALLARNTGNDPAEFLRLQGMFREAGFDDTVQRQAMLYTAGAAQRGAVEAGSITRESMGAVMRRMSDATSALGPGATPEQRQAAALQAFREQFAELQVFRGSGFSVRNSGEALSNLQMALRNTGRQDKILNNIRSRREASTDPAERARLQALEMTMFENDPTRRGSMRLRAGMQNPLAFVAGMSKGMQGNATAIMNLLSGTGAGNPMSLLLNQRSLIGALAATNANGRSGADRVMDLLSPDVALTEQRVREGAAIYGGDALSQLNREETARESALTSNTSAIKRLSDQIAGWAANNPLTTAALSAGGAGLVGMLPAAGSALAAAAAGSSAAGAVGGAAAAGAAGLAAAGAALGAAGLVGAYGPGQIISERLEQNAIGRNADGSAQDQVRSVFQGSTWSDLLQELRGLPSAIGAAVNGSSPQAALHANARNATATSPPPEYRSRL